MNEKKKLREFIWKEMEKRKIARFPGAANRIPNFVGSEKAAVNVRNLEMWKRAKIVAANPDFAQRPLREFALRDGKTLIMATPKLKNGYLLIKPENVKGRERYASTIKGAFVYGKKIAVHALPKPDLIITGCVAVDVRGNRLGKGGGYGDREISFFQKKFGKVPVITTVHEMQIVEDVPHEAHDTKVDIIVTPERVIEIHPHQFAAGTRG